MQTIWTMWRHPACVLTLVGIVAVTAYRSTFVDPANYEGYLVSTFAGATIFLIFACPVAAASAAIVASRARRAGIWSQPVVRSRATVTFRLLLPSFLAGATVQAFGLYLLMSSSWGAPGRVPFEIVVAWASILLLHASVGHPLGRFLPIAVSIPLSIFASYSWLGFTWSVSYFPLRYLSGLVISACCSVDTTLDQRAVVSVVVFSILMSAALLIGATVPSRHRHWHTAPLMSATAIACGILAVTLGLNSADGIGAQPTTPRDRADLVCEGTTPKICVYPEQLQGEDPRPALASAYNNLRAAGVALPEVITTSNTAQDTSALRVVLTTRPTPEQLVYTTAAALIPDDVAVDCGDADDYARRLDVAAVAVWWLQTIAGEGLIDVSAVPPGSISPDSDRLIRDFAHLSPSAQRAWYFAASPALTDCSVPPLGVPRP